MLQIVFIVIVFLILIVFFSKKVDISKKELSDPIQRKKSVKPLDNARKNLRNILYKSPKSTIQPSKLESVKKSRASIAKINIKKLLRKASPSNSTVQTNKLENASPINRANIARRNLKRVAFRVLKKIKIIQLRPRCFSPYQYLKKLNRWVMVIIGLLLLFILNPIIFFVFFTIFSIFIIFNSNINNHLSHVFRYIVFTLISLIFVFILLKFLPVISKFSISSLPYSFRNISTVVRDFNYSFFLKKDSAENEIKTDNKKDNLFDNFKFHTDLNNKNIKYQERNIIQGKTNKGIDNDKINIFKKISKLNTLEASENTINYQDNCYTIFLPSDHNVYYCILDISKNKTDRVIITLISDDREYFSKKIYDCDKNLVKNIGQGNSLKELNSSEPEQLMRPIRKESIDYFIGIDACS